MRLVQGSVRAAPPLQPLGVEVKGGILCFPSRSPLDSVSSIVIVTWDAPETSLDSVPENMVKSSGVQERQLPPFSYNNSIYVLASHSTKVLTQDSVHLWPPLLGMCELWELMQVLGWVDTWLAGLSFTPSGVLCMVEWRCCYSSCKALHIGSILYPSSPGLGTLSPICCSQYPSDMQDCKTACGLIFLVIA